MAAIPRGSFIWLVLFIVLTFPFALAILPSEFTSTPFSIYNTSWDGLSEFKELIMEVNPNAEIRTLVGSTNALNRLNSTGGADSGTLIIMGPKASYDPTEAIAIMLYFLKGGRLVIADDFGTANDILYYFSLILQAIATADTNPLGLNTNTTGNGGDSEFAPRFTLANQINQLALELNLPSLFDPLKPYLTPYTPGGRILWKLARPDLSFPVPIGQQQIIPADQAVIPSIFSQTQAQTQVQTQAGNRVPSYYRQQQVDPADLAQTGFDILKSIVAIAINQSVLIDTENYVKSPVQPILKPPSTASGSIVPFWIENWIIGVDEVVANYAAILSMKVRYPTNFTNREDPNQIIDYNTWFNLGLPAPLGQGSPELRAQYVASHFETLWVPFGNFQIELPANLQSFAENFDFQFSLSALYSSDRSWLEGNVTAAKNVNNIAPDANEWGNLEFPVAAMFPIGFEDESPQLYLISDPSIFLNKYVGTTPTGSSPADPEYFDPTIYSNRQFAENLITLFLGNRSNSKIYFDEGHLAQSYTNPMLYMGLFFRFLDIMTMFPLLAPFLPITILGLARKYAPQGRKAAAPLLMTKIERYTGHSYFAFKMRWLLEYQNFPKGLELIYRRFRREMTKRYKLADFNPEIAYAALLNEFPMKIKKNVIKKLQDIEQAIAVDQPLTEENFMSHYLALKDIFDLIRK